MRTSARTARVNAVSPIAMSPRSTPHTSASTYAPTMTISARRARSTTTAQVMTPASLGWSGSSRRTTLRTPSRTRSISMGTRIKHHERPKQRLELHRREDPAEDARHGQHHGDHAADGFLVLDGLALPDYGDQHAGHHRQPCHADHVARGGGHADDRAAGRAPRRRWRTRRRSPSSSDTRTPRAGVESGRTRK